MIEDPTEIEVALFYAAHIENPCVEPITGKNIREIYLREARRKIESFIDPNAISFLESIMRNYPN